MILVDTSVWIGHFRVADKALGRLLDEASVLVHPFVIGEIVCGSLRHRDEVLAAMRRLPAVPVAREEEVHHVLEAHRLHATGLGWVDLHLLASARLAAVPLLTHDRALRSAAARVLA
jgi:predicted nucleic acid-binding protein